jgi:hypothetical protein
MSLIFVEVCSRTKFCATAFVTCESVSLAQQAHRIAISGVRTGVRTLGSSGFIVSPSSAEEDILHSSDRLRECGFRFGVLDF